MDIKLLEKIMVNDKDMKDPGKQIIELMDKRNSMPEFKMLLKLKSLESSLYVFRKNYKELRDLLIKHSDTREAIRLRQAGKKPEMRLFLYEIARLLHNYVTSVKSLVAHTRIIYREIYKEPEKFPEYQAEVDRRFANNPLAQFIEDLRDYCLHYKLPTTPSVLRFSNLSPTPVFESKIILKTEDLNKYSNWSSLGKKYLRSQNEPINLLNVIDEYYNLVEDFHNWIQSRQQEILSEELAKVTSIQQQIENLEKKT